MSYIEFLEAKKDWFIVLAKNGMFSGLRVGEKFKDLGLRFEV